MSLLPSLNKAPVQDLGFEYQIKRSWRKSAAIHVRAGVVEVRIPFGIDENWVAEFVYEKRHWVQKKLAAMAVKSAQAPSLQWQSDVLWMGQSKTLVYVWGKKKAVKIVDDQLQIQGPNAPDQAQLSALLQRFFKQQAKVYLTTRTLEISEKIGLQGKLKQVTFRRTKTKWGHCTSQGTIQYNWLIMGAPDYVIEYLIYHELTHLIHPNHSARYWAQVKAFYPGFELGKAWLKHNSHRLGWC